MCSWGLNEWGDIANIVIAVASVATAIVTARMLIKQHKLQQEQLNAQQLEHQPIFELIQCEDSFTISAKGASMVAPAKIEITPIITIEPAKSVLEDGRYRRYLVTIPYQRYVTIKPTNNLSGQIVECQNVDTDKLLRLKHIAENVELWLKRPTCSGIVGEDLPVYTKDLIKIEYVDMYKIKRILYYFGTNEIPQWLYDIMQEGIHDHPFGPYDISDINTNFIIQEILKFRHKLPYNE